MKVEFIKTPLVGSVHRTVGEVADFPESLARRLIKEKTAKQYVAPPESSLERATVPEKLETPENRKRK